MGTHAIPLGGTAAGGQRKRGDSTKLSDAAVNLTVLLCAKVRNSSKRDRSGTAAGPQNVGIPTIPGCRRDRFRRRRDHFTCKLIRAGPHPPFGNYINIPGGVDVLEGVRIFLGCLVSLISVVSLAVSKWGLSVSGSLLPLRAVLTSGFEGRRCRLYGS